MPHTHHIEKHFTATATVRDIVIGMSDGLTVPFALTAGLAAAVTDRPDVAPLILTAGLAEIAAGAIAMGLGGYLAAKTDAEHYESERAREERETEEIPEEEAAEVGEIFRGYGMDEATVDAVVKAIRFDRKRWIDFMMRFELGLEEPNPNRARTSAFTIGASYIAGGLIPMSPYFFLLHKVQMGLIVSVGLTALALLIFGYIKGRFTTHQPVRSAWRTLVVGALAGAAAFTMATLFGK